MALSDIAARNAKPVKMYKLTDEQGFFSGELYFGFKRFQE